MKITFPGVGKSWKRFLTVWRLFLHRDGQPRSQLWLIWEWENFSHLKLLYEAHLLSMRWTQQPTCRGACQKKSVLLGGRTGDRKFCPTKSRFQKQCWSIVRNPERERFANGFTKMSGKKTKLNVDCWGRETAAFQPRLCTVCQVWILSLGLRAEQSKPHGGAFRPVMFIKSVPPTQGKPCWESQSLQGLVKRASQGLQHTEGKLSFKKVHLIKVEVAF